MFTSTLLIFVDIKIRAIVWNRANETFFDVCVRCTSLLARRTVIQVKNRIRNVSNLGYVISQTTKCCYHDTLRML